MEVRQIIHVLKGKANPNTMNGVNKVVHNLATTQLSQGYDVEVWGISDNPNHISHQHDYPLHLFKASRNRFATGQDMIKALDAVPSATIFHLHSVFLPELYALSRHLKRRGIKWVLTPHGGYGPGALKKNRLTKTIYKKLFEDRLIVDSAAIHSIGFYGEADQFSETMRKAKVGVVPNGQEVSPVFKKFYQVEGPLRLCYCGRLVLKHKGLDLLLSALAITVNNHIDAALELIGDGPDREKLKSMCKSLGLSERVTFHGVKMSPEKESIILTADLFVHTSRWDGMPTAVLEAAALGLPLLVSLPTNIADYVAKASAGFVVEDLTPACIAHAIANAASAKKSGRLMSNGCAAREMIIDKFSWARIATSLCAEVYAKAIDR